MAAKLVWLTDSPPRLTCGHDASSTNGRPGHGEREWWCELCALHIVAQLDQELAAAEERARERGAS